MEDKIWYTLKFKLTADGVKVFFSTSSPFVDKRDKEFSTDQEMIGYFMRCLTGKYVNLKGFSRVYFTCDASEIYNCEVRKNN